MKQKIVFICILLRASFFISVYFILAFLKALRKSLELRICHTSSEDIADGNVPGIVLVVPSYTQVFHDCII